MRVLKLLPSLVLGTIALSASLWAAGHGTMKTGDSVVHRPQLPRAPKDAPSVLIIQLDDIGFADASTFGGVAHTPALERLAAEGLRYNNFHTAAICSATRAALLSGRNHHRVGFGKLPPSPVTYPAGYNSVWKKSAASIAQVLRLNGYSTAAFGKWHNTPFHEISPVGPFDRWPTGLGFEYFYGFMHPGAQSHWEPASLYRNTTPVEPPPLPAPGYHLTTDLTDDAIRWLRTHESLAPEQPYFLYFATGAVHWPHHVPPAWIAKYRGKFDQGWDRLREEIFARQKALGVIPEQTHLTPRPKALPAWDALSRDQQQLYARQMEIYAAFIAHTDHEVGRLLQVVREGSRGDNTLVLYVVGDNGGGGGGHLDFRALQDQLQNIDALGGPLYINGIARGWGWASSTPFQWFKGVASHFGGVRNPLVASWPRRIQDRGGLRTQFTHVNDIAATIYDVAGIDAPPVVDGVKQLPLDGVSFAASFDNKDAMSGHRVQYFEMDGNRAIYANGWVAAARHDGSSGTRCDFAQDRWELYRVSDDFSEAHDLASQYPAKLKELQALFDVEARKNDVYPLLPGCRIAAAQPPSLTDGRNTFVYHAEQPRVPALAAPDFRRSHVITAEIVVGDQGSEGILVSYGGRFGGFALYVKGGRVMYENNFFGERRDVITSNVVLPPGTVTITYEFVRATTKKKEPWFETSVGHGRLYVNGQLVGEATLETAADVLSWGSFGVGQAFGSPVSEAFQVPFKFTGAIEQVRVQLR